MSADAAWGDRNESDDRARATLQHDAYSYGDLDGYVTDLLGFVRGGLARDEPVLIAVPGPNLALLHAGLSVREAAQVRMRDMAMSGRNPGRILGSVLTAFVHEHPGHRVRIISEAIWPDRTDRRPPRPSEIGHGLYVLHQVADLVRVHLTGDGTSVRAYFRHT
jgi:hypothetical protein